MHHSGPSCTGRKLEPLWRPTRAWGTEESQALSAEPQSSRISGQAAKIRRALAHPIKHQCRLRHDSAGGRDLGRKPFVSATFGRRRIFTWEARIKFDCVTNGCWPAWWLSNDHPEVGGEIDLVEWYTNQDWPSGTTVHAREDGTSFATQPWPVDSAWHNGA